MGNTNMIPNIASQGYPNVDNLNAFASESTFNYALWSANCKLTATRVPWDIDYKNVVKFDSSGARDGYFNSLSARSTIINKAVRVPKDGIVMLPFNYDEIITFNYLIAEYPLPGGYTAKQNNLKTKYYYFIEDMEYKNANVTECKISLDYWTTFIDDVIIGDSVLHRGHAPMTLVSVDTFLSDPISHTSGLLTPDVNFGEINTVKNEDFVSLQSGHKYVVIATSSNPEGTWTNNVTCTNVEVNDGLPNNIVLFAVKPDNFSTLITNINNNIPQFMQTIQAIYLVDASFITTAGAFTFQSVSCYYLTSKKTKLKDIELTRSMFDIPSDYEWITKLYTFPYSQLEITDNNGNTALINVEDTSSDLSVRSMSSLIFPFLDLKMFLTGVGGKGYNTYNIEKYTWNELTNTFMYKDDWQKYTFNFDIPVYGIFQKNSVNYDFSTKFDRIQEQNNINTSSENNIRSINTGYDNSIRSNSTSATNSTNSVNTGYNNNIDTIDTNTDILNNDLTCARNVMLKNNAKLDYDVAKQNSMLEKQYIANKGVADVAADYSIISTLLSAITVSATAAGALVSGAAAVGTASSAVAAEGAAAEGAAAGSASASVGLAQTALANISAIGNTMINSSHPVINQAIWDAGGPNEALKDETKAMNLDLVSMQETTANDIYTLEKTRAQTDNTNRVNTQKANLNNSKTTSLGNINRSKSTADTNASDSKTTSLANNTASKTNSETAITNKINQAALGNNVSIGSYGGNAQSLVEGVAGLDIKVKTQNNELLKKTGGIFAKYGYMYDDLWDVNSLKLMNHFTYWEFSDIWLYSNKVFEGALDKLREIFINGVSVWNEPTEIGNIRIKNNHLPDPEPV